MAKKKKPKTDRQILMEKFEKDCQEASKARKANRKLREAYKSDSEKAENIRQKLIADLKRVWKHPHNPFRGFSASRDRYRQLGHFPEVMVTDLFGNHQEFQRAAGIRDARGTTKVKNLTAKLHAEAEILKYAKEYIEPYYGVWDRRTRATTGVKTVVVISDAHGKFIDPFAKEVMFDVVRMVQPDGVVANGDMVDFPKVGRFTEIPGAGNLSLQDELDFVREEIFRPLTNLCPDAYRIYVMGNHEQRLVRYLADTAPELADLRCLRWDRLLEIDEMGWELVFGGNWLAPRQGDRTRNIRRTWKVLHDCFVVTHGASIAKNAMESEIQRYGMSGTSGHTHRPGLWTLPTLAGKHLSWTSTGMLASFAVGKDYMAKSPSAWTMGFAVFTIDPKTKTVTPPPDPHRRGFCGIWRQDLPALESGPGSEGQTMVKRRKIRLDRPERPSIPQKLS